ncbi:male-specific lethal 3 homolog isoform X1, partial [Paramuricea clavata]
MNRSVETTLKNSFQVLEVDFTKDEKGKKVPEYFVHFSGWNKSWDRWVMEDQIVPGTEMNRQRMKRLHEEAITCLKNRKKRKSAPANVDTSKSQLETSSESLSATPTQCIQTPSSPSEPHIDIEIPCALKLKLEDDCYFIKRKKKLVRLPRSPNVIDILKEYVNHVTLQEDQQQPSPDVQSSVNIVKEVMDGLRVYFDFTLASVLLYNMERDQHDRVMHETGVKRQNEVKTDEQSDNNVFFEKSRKKNDSTVDEAKEKSETKPSINSENTAEKSTDESKDDQSNGRVLRRRSKRHSVSASTTSSLTSSTSGATIAAREGSQNVASDTKTSAKKGMKRKLATPKEDEENSSTSEKSSITAESSSTSSPIRPSQVYGIEHLLRLFVRLPSLLAKTTIEENKLSLLLHHLKEFLRNGRNLVENCDVSDGELSPLSLCIMRKSRMGRRRKHSHRIYKTSTTDIIDTDQGLPYKFQFHLRNLPATIFTHPSINNFIEVFKLLVNVDILAERWTMVNHDHSFVMLSTFCENGKLSPSVEKTVIVNEDLTWNCIIKNKNVKENVRGICNTLNDTNAFILLLDFMDACKACSGIQDNKLIELSKLKNRNGVFKDRQGNIKGELKDDDVIRPVDCCGVVPTTANGNLCDCCKSYRKCLLTILLREKRKSLCEVSLVKANTKVNSHCPWKHLSEEEHKKRVNNCRQDRRQQFRQIQRLKKRFEDECIELVPDNHTVMETLFTDLQSQNKCENKNDFKSLLLEEQEKAMQCSDKRGRRWHPLIIRWCFQMHATSPKAYQMLRESGILTLPHSRTLHDYSQCFKANIGFDPSFLDIVKKDFLDRCNPKECDSWIGIIHDEVSLRQDLVFDDAGRLVGFVNLGSTQNAIDSLEDSLSVGGCSTSSPVEATHMILFMAVSLCSDWKMPIAFFPTTTIKSFSLFNLFWKCVEELEERDFKVLTTTCDGASPHRTFYKYHIIPGDTQTKILYKTPNPYADEQRPLFFICDPVHLLKTARNNWENSFWKNKTKKLRNNNRWISWLQLIDAFENDINDSNAS